MKRTRWLNILCLGLIMSAGGSVAALANVATFTWNPTGASPPLGLPASAFTADSMTGSNYLWAAQVPSGPSLRRWCSASTGLPLAARRFQRQA